MRMLGLTTVAVCAQTLCAATNYVSLTGSSTAPYSSWATAATNIQAAVDAAVDGDLVLVAAGTYFGPAPLGESGSVLTITNAITLAGAGGAAATVVDALGNQKRCLYLGNSNATVHGFTFTQGRARIETGSQSYPDSVGGGAFVDGGGTIELCIFVYNGAGNLGEYGVGGALYMNGGTLRNCVVKDSWAPQCGGVYCTNSAVVESCTIVNNTTTTTNLPGGIWCIDGGAVTNTILWANSNAFDDAVDVHTEGVNWSFAYCRVPPGVPGVGNVSNDPGFVDYAGGNLRLAANSVCDGAGTNLPWMDTAFDFDNNSRISKGTVDMGAYETPGVYYVAPNGGHVSPFTTWATAATNIESALAVAFPGTLVVVSNGVYTPAAELSINTNITVVGTNGPAVTTIMGGSGRRCASLRAAGAVLDGFTLTGAVQTNSANGGGVNLSAGTVRNCIVRGNSTPGLGGGVQMSAGTLVENTVISGNYGDNSGGGGVIVMGNGTLRNCVIANNGTKGSGAFGPMGGGGVLMVSGGTLDNCTVVQNTSGNNGGGIYYVVFGPSSTGVVRNTIIHDNVATVSGPNYAGTLLSFVNSCTEPAVPAGMDGGGNVAADPAFAALVPGIFRLGYGSPCIDTGSNMAWMAGAKDVLGNPRIARGTVDMGAYEVPEIHDVAPSGTHIAPFTNWVEAATTIVAAVNVAMTGSVVAVGSGVYQPGGEMQIIKPITVQGAAGWSMTVVDGMGGVGRFFARCATAVVKGFTMTNCVAPTGGGPGPMGGGATIDPGIIQDCLLTCNGAGAMGGGLQIGGNGGVAYNCRISGNVASSGGGVLLLGGKGKLWNCLVDRNTQTGSFMGIANGGAGVISVGGGEIANCTIAANASSNNGGGILHLVFPPFGMTGDLFVINSIVSGNTAGDGSSNYYHTAYNAHWQNTCTAPELTNVVDGGGNLFVDPAMIDWQNGNFRIPYSSPCVNAGSNLAWTAFATDLDGNDRVTGGTVDMGAYEAVPEPVAAASLFVIGCSLLVVRRRRLCGAISD